MIKHALFGRLDTKLGRERAIAPFTTIDVATKHKETMPTCPACPETQAHGIYQIQRF